MKKIVKGILLIIISTFFTAAGQFFFKKAASQLSYNPVSLLTNHYFFIGGFAYLFAVFLLTYGLSFGQLNILYPIISLNIIWVTLLSVLFLKEIITIPQVTGIFSIMIGIVLITRG